MYPAFSKRFVFTFKNAISVWLDVQNGEKKMFSNENVLVWTGPKVTGISNTTYMMSYSI